MITELENGVITNDVYCIPKVTCEQLLRLKGLEWKNWTGTYTKWASHDFWFIPKKMWDTDPVVMMFMEYMMPVFHAYNVKPDTIRLTRYKVGDYIGNHQDVGDMERKLTIVIQLSDPKDYEGGELIVEGKKACDLQGAVLVHDPIKDWHEVKPVTKGTRYTVVIWCK